METEVARKIENAIATLQGIKHIYTKVQDGAATITVESLSARARISWACWAPSARASAASR